MSDILTTTEIFKHSELLFSPAQIQVALEKMAQQIAQDFHDKNPLCLIVMQGGVIFAGHLLPQIQIPLELDYLHATRYRGEFQGSDAIHWLVKPNASLKDRNLLILDDILDEGITLMEVINFCYAHGALSVKTAVLVDKKVPRAPHGLAHADYAALQAPAEYLFGYGMDCKEYWRNAPGIYALKK